MAMIPATHPVFGECMVPDTWPELYPDDWSAFTPAGRNVADVIAYLTDAEPEERERVLALERAATEPRVTILRAFPSDTETPAAVGAGDTDTGTAPGTSTED